MKNGLLRILNDSAGGGKKEGRGGRRNEEEGGMRRMEGRGGEKMTEGPESRSVMPDISVMRADPFCLGASTEEIKRQESGLS